MRFFVNPLNFPSTLVHRIINKMNLYKEKL